ncbi:MAG: hypothetical protein LH606_21010 [Cytophagaceae bacterium]|nr:hypothetical protein [Cytophagaceae bacterium]
MKKLFFTLCPLLFAFGLSAQEASEKRAITADEYDAVKKVVVKNPEKETYVKADKFILDASQPPFVFKFSDGNERRVYLYKLFETEKMAELGMVAIFTTVKDGKKVVVPIPSPAAPGEVWGKYIDDLKYGERDNNGLAPCIAFALTKSGVGGAPVTAAKEGDKYEYCFPAESQVTLADGSAKAISTLKAGEKVLSFNAQTQQSEVATIRAVQIHENQTFALTRLTLIDPAERISASINGLTTRPIRLEATANHPVLTATGRKAIGNVRVGEKMYLSENERLKVYEVFTAQQAVRQVGHVYNLVTDRETYLVNGILVFRK